MIKKKKYHIPEYEKFDGWWIKPLFIIWFPFSAIAVIVFITIYYWFLDRYHPKDGDQWLVDWW